MKCIIVDDEPLAREGLRHLIMKNGNLELLNSFNSVAPAEAFLQENDVDVIFLDIEMPDDSGLEFAKNINKKILLIFTTAYPQYAIDSYEVEALDYLLKPINQTRFDKAVEKAAIQMKLLQTHKSTFETSNEIFIIIKAERKYHRILFKDIIYLEGLKDYVVIHTKKDKFVTAMNIKTLHIKLPAEVFLRVSKSYVVNMNVIDSFDRTTIFIDDLEIPIGRTYQNEIHKHFLG
ncbi:LytTR family DNA-binding domain-containing protein [Flavobacterium sp. CFBP9031]|uniref:LytR/AlgR family response regulator transcription factor n=1 Tax=Flavobacterium sp. CFBP9031 TaxID=3096538 RepID=UPI002A6A1B56|nr:LytTR family DNA-binding domain-containing protein [Flavobacterium sp. CFBP9031]MDY0986667.1 LytTR family DNA-binding domain-containing protein [Flavobacterium sp. CFBP9031]